MDFTIPRNVLLKRWRELLWMNACIFDGGVEIVQTDNIAGAKVTLSSEISTTSDPIRRNLSQSTIGEQSVIVADEKMVRTNVESVEAVNSALETVGAPDFDPFRSNTQSKEGIHDLKLGKSIEILEAKSSRPSSPSELDKELIRDTDRRYPVDRRSVQVDDVQPSPFSNPCPVNSDNINDYNEYTKIYDRMSETASSERQKSNTKAMTDSKHVESIGTVAETIMPTLSHNPNPEPIVNSANDNNAPHATLGQPSMTMFNGVSNAAFLGGNFVQNNTMGSKRGLKILEKRVATAAFHNSAQRIDPPRCHPDTRVQILQNIYDWIMKSGQRDEWIMWLNGAAGAGKSAIIQSIADRLAHVAGIAIASFFFFRADSTRNTIEPLVATLVYQLIQAIPEISDEVLLIIERNPLIFGQTLESQLQHLIIQPLLRLPRHLQRLIVVFIDGLDECNDRKAQANLIKVLGNVSGGENIPLVFLLASRREPQIEAEFVRKPVCEILQILPLDNSDVEQTSEDIRRFLVDRFNDIKDNHLFKRHLPVDWPAVTLVEEIIDKSSGQFIFASVVINYLSSPRANPVHQLEVVRGIRLRDPSSQNPFAHLDALYQHIFSQVETLGKVFDIIALVLLVPLYLYHIERAFLLEAGELDVLFADLTAVILCEPSTGPESSAQLKFLHASLPDFLRDESRSEQYYVDLDEYRTKLLCMFLERAPPILDPLWLANDLQHAIDQERSRLLMIWNLLKLAGLAELASERLRGAFMKFNSTFYSIIFLDNLWNNIGSDILQYLEQLDFGDQGEAYRHVVAVFAAEYAKYWPFLLDDYKDNIKQDSPDLGVGIDQIQQQAI